jgi:BA14K-like protein
MTPGKIFVILVSSLLASIAIALAFIAYAAAQERHGYGGGGRERGGNVTVNKYYGGHGGGPRYGSYYHRPRYGIDPSAAVGGAIGGWLYRQWAQPAEPVRDVAWCMNRYRSYDPYTRTYLGYDGLRHGCP